MYVDTIALFNQTLPGLLKPPDNRKDFFTVYQSTLTQCTRAESKPKRNQKQPRAAKRKKKETNKKPSEPKFEI